MSSAPSSGGHSPPPPMKQKSRVSGYLSLALIGLAVISIFAFCSMKTKDDETTTAVTQSAPAQSAPAVQLEPNAGRMLTIDRKTPFCDQMEYSASFETEGDSIRILYDSGGDSRSIRYLGKGDNLEGTFLQRTPGKPICFESLDSSKTVRVRIYRVVNIYLKQP